MEAKDGTGARDMAAAATAKEARDGAREARAKVLGCTFWTFGMAAVASPMVTGTAGERLERSPVSWLSHREAIAHRRVLCCIPHGAENPHVDGPRLQQP